MKRDYSLKGRELYKYVSRNGVKIRGNGIEIIFLKLNNDHEIVQKVDFFLKAGIVLNRKYGKAVERNKTKRRIRSILDEVIKTFESGYCLIIRPGFRFKYMEYSEQKKDLLLLLHKARIME